MLVICKSGIKKPLACTDILECIITLSRSKATTESDINSIEDPVISENKPRLLYNKINATVPNTTILYDAFLTFLYLKVDHQQHKNVTHTII